GELADRICDAAQAAGAAMCADDLASHKADWVGTMSADYRGLRVHEIPPNGQGVAALAALAILQQTSIHDERVDSADSLHLQIEAMKLALADVYAHVADPSAMKMDPMDM